MKIKKYKSKLKRKLLKKKKSSIVEDTFDETTPAKVETPPIEISDEAYELCNEILNGDFIQELSQPKAMEAIKQIALGGAEEINILVAIEFFKYKVENDTLNENELNRMFQFLFCIIDNDSIYKYLTFDSKPNDLTLQILEFLNLAPQTSLNEQTKELITDKQTMVAEQYKNFIEKISNAVFNVDELALIINNLSNQIQSAPSYRVKSSLDFIFEILTQLNSCYLAKEVTSSPVELAIANFINEVRKLKIEELAQKIEEVDEKFEENILFAQDVTPKEKEPTVKALNPLQKQFVLKINNIANNTIQPNTKEYTDFSMEIVDNIQKQICATLAKIQPDEFSYNNFNNNKFNSQNLLYYFEEIKLVSNLFRYLLINDVKDKTTPRGNLQQLDNLYHFFQNLRKLSYQKKNYYSGIIITEALNCDYVRTLTRPFQTSSHKQADNFFSKKYNQLLSEQSLNEISTLEESNLKGIKKFLTVGKHIFNALNLIKQQGEQQENQYVNLSNLAIIIFHGFSQKLSYTTKTTITDTMLNEKLSSQAQMFTLSSPYLIGEESQYHDISKLNELLVNHCGYNLKNNKYCLELPFKSSTTSSFNADRIALRNFILHKINTQHTLPDAIEALQCIESLHRIFITNGKLYGLIIDMVFSDKSKILGAYNNKVTNLLADFDNSYKTLFNFFWKFETRIPLLLKDRPSTLIPFTPSSFYFSQVEKLKSKRKEYLHLKSQRETGQSQRVHVDLLAKFMEREGSHAFQFKSGYHHGKEAVQDAPKEYQTVIQSESREIETSPEIIGESIIARDIFSDKKDLGHLPPFHPTVLIEIIKESFPWVIEKEIDDEQRIFEDDLLGLGSQVPNDIQKAVMDFVILAVDSLGLYAGPESKLYLHNVNKIYSIILNITKVNEMLTNSSIPKDKDFLSEINSYKQNLLKENQSLYLEHEVSKDINLNYPVNTFLYLNEDELHKHINYQIILSGKVETQFPHLLPKVVSIDGQIKLDT